MILEIAANLTLILPVAGYMFPLVFQAEKLNGFAIISHAFKPMISFSMPYCDLKLCILNQNYSIPRCVVGNGGADASLYCPMRSNF